MSGEESIMAPPAQSENGNDAPPAAQGDLPRQQVRERLLRQFEQWMDRMLAGERPPQGLPPELLPEPLSTKSDEPAHECDLYTLFSSLTSLSGEIRLQGRAFKQLSDILSPLTDVPDRLKQLEAAQVEALDHLQDLRNQQQSADARELSASENDICQVLLDLHDRLDRGLRTCDSGIQSLRVRTPSGWLRRWAGTDREIEQAIESAQAIRDATAMTLTRLQSALHDWGIQPVGQAGEPFDPQRMTAIHVQPSSQVEPGTVLEVNRSGYAINGQLKATAQVTVSKAASAQGNGIEQNT